MPSNDNLPSAAGLRIWLVIWFVLNVLAAGITAAWRYIQIMKAAGTR